MTAYFNPDSKKIKVAGLLAVENPSSSGFGSIENDGNNKMASKFFSTEFSSLFVKDPTPFHISESRDLNGPLMAKMVVDLQYPAEGLALVNPATAFTISCDGKLIRFRIPLTVPAARTKQGAYVIPFEELLTGHVVVGGSRVLLAPGGQFVVSYAQDGSVTLREVNKLPKGRVSIFYPHDFRFGSDGDAASEGANAIVQIAFSRDLSAGIYFLLLGLLLSFDAPDVF